MPTLYSVDSPDFDHNEVGIIYDELGQIDNAISSFRAAVHFSGMLIEDAEDTRIISHTNLAIALLSSSRAHDFERIDEAALNLVRALSIVPDDQSDKDIDLTNNPV